MTEQNWHEKYLSERRAKQAFANCTADLIDALKETLDKYEQLLNDIGGNREQDRLLIAKFRKNLL